MEKHLYLMRHGQTLFNRKHLISGWSDSPVTELGLEQARRAGEFFRACGIEFDHVCCSDLRRACVTAGVVEPGLPHETLEDLREWFFGLYEAERVLIMPHPPPGDYFCQFGGESQYSVRERMVRCLTEVMGCEQNRCVLAVSHGRSCKEFLDAVLAEHADPNARVPGNCGTLHFTFDGKGFEFVEAFDQDDYAQELGLSPLT